MASQKALAFGKWLCNKYKVNYRFGTVDKAIARPWENYIYVCKNWSTDEFLSAVFHEIQHCINFREEKYKAYHSGRVTLKDYKRWSLPAEIYTDNKAKKLANEHKFFNYVVVYKNNKYSKIFLNSIMERYF